MTMSRMSMAWLKHHCQNGSGNWDIAIYKLMSVVLVTGLEYRSGDVARSRGYLGTEYLQHRHIELVLEGDEAVLHNLHKLNTLFLIASLPPPTIFSLSWTIVFHSRAYWVGTNLPSTILPYPLF
jgi:hypothetical protein